MNHTRDDSPQAEKVNTRGPGRESGSKPESAARSFAQRASYAVMRQVLRLAGVIGFGVRSFGRENFPPDGGAMVLSNHQSNLDPPLIGMLANRRMNYLAKKSLFGTQPLKWLIEHLDAIPIDRGGMGFSGVKETIRRLRRGEMVLIFPEGQRTWDGEMTALMPGFIAIARRTGVPLVPIGMDGAFIAWRRGTRIPKFGRIWLVIGKPLTVNDYEHLSDEELLVLLENRLRECFDKAREYRIRKVLR